MTFGLLGNELIMINDIIKVHYLIMGSENVISGLDASHMFKVVLISND